MISISECSVTFLFGVCLGVVVNWASKTFSYLGKNRQGTRSVNDTSSGFRVLDFIPVIRWLYLSLSQNETEEKVSVWRWLRPLLVELGMGIFCVWFYYFHVTRIFNMADSLGVSVSYSDYYTLLAKFVFQSVLVALMFSVSMIDADERIIPDGIIIPGTLFALICAAVFPVTLPWNEQVSQREMQTVLGVPNHSEQNSISRPIRIESCTQLPYFPEIFIDGGKTGILHIPINAVYPACIPGWVTLGNETLTNMSLVEYFLEKMKGPISGIICLWMWCFALAPRVWYARRGKIPAIIIFMHHLLKSPETWMLYRVGGIGAILIFLTWFLGGAHWINLWSSLVGMAITGGFFWLIRLACSWVMGREALGFGDVTLMFMIGAALGWQAGVMIFFLAPFAGLILGGMMVVLRGDPELPYGPFLCMAALFVMIYWESLLYLANPFLVLGLWLIPLAAVCLTLMMLLLGMSRLVKFFLRRITGKND